jgi:fructosamine-3-kinase
MISEEKIKARIEEKLSKIKSLTSLSGGCISDAFKVICRWSSTFLNNNQLQKICFQRSKRIESIIKADAIEFPNLVLKITYYLNTLQLAKSKNFYEEFGRRFAEMHKFTADSFGFYEDNYIGSNPQINIPNEKEKTSWVNFYFNKRILFQFKLADKFGNATPDLRKGISKLENKIEEIIGNSAEKPSLLHGDLWGGNYMVDENGNAVLIDPAVYYGHRADLE